jgi:hypothetical protein
MTKHKTGTREEWLAARLELHVSRGRASHFRQAFCLEASKPT